MTFSFEELDQIIKDGLVNNNYLVIEEEIYNKLSVDDAHYINHITHNLLFRLPENEIKFFEWLKEVEPIVWQDLWKSDNITEVPYLVSISFLPVIVENKDRGFPICDLRSIDNYFFSIDHMVDEESKVFFDVSKEKLKNRERMTMTELLSLEISVAPIDIWHFAYKFKLDLNKCKDAVHQLSKDNALVHLKDAEYLAPFINF